jgi:hypothetical protein
MTAKWFLRCGVLFCLLGMSLGIFMGASHDFSYVSVHAHINLVGWVSMFLAGLFYTLKPQCEGLLSRIHLALAVVGLLVLAPGIYGATMAMPWGAPVAILGSFLTLGAALIFAVMVFRATRTNG